MTSSEREFTIKELLRVLETLKSLSPAFPAQCQEWTDSAIGSIATIAGYLSALPGAPDAPQPQTASRTIPQSLPCDRGGGSILVQTPCPGCGAAIDIRIGLRDRSCPEIIACQIPVNSKEAVCAS